MSQIEKDYLIKHAKSAELYTRSLACFPSGVTHDIRYLKPFPIYSREAKAGRKWDVDGNEYVDFFMGHGALLLGHSNPNVVQAIQNQAGLATHSGASHELEVEWAELVKQLIPSAEKVRFHSSGTESTLMALRLARGYTGKDKIVKFQSHFHGWHDYMVKGNATLTGVPKGVSDTVIVLPPNDIDIVEKTLKEDKDIAAVILEPTGANFGVFPVFPSFLRDLRESTKRHGVLLIFDEVVTGFRISKGGAQERYGVTPDMTTLAKILAGGMPGGASTGRADIMDMISHTSDAEWNTQRRIAHQGTFNANPMAAAAGVAALSQIASQPINEKADANAKILKDGLNDLFARIEVPGCACGVASIVEVKLGTPCVCPHREVCEMSHEAIKGTMRPDFSSKLRLALINAGMDTSRGTLLMVSAAHTKKDIDDTIFAYERAITALRKEELL
jgi:glutamate-1-semialdehyde 2,1-aminomutase